ncbi:FAD-dependent oxidoreductase [Hathewaya histolytica]|uniref:Dehydrogenase, FAD-dependent n=1 Tax=Hathewaya histolytica TaxID=1498 RepID=A0A4U9QSM4_HATHI|nr:FAD-dependent oxidoreductase [Hathewaya histolytica]VTQ81505.1 dehydrogenase, FAD-dependent [Hathewaya histolytica]
MDYDVLVLGGGLIGCAIAYEISKYNLNIALIEKDYDIADDVALVNTSIVFDGLECEDSFTSKLEAMGNGLMDEVTEKFNVPFKRLPSLILSKDESYIDNLYDRALKKGIKNIDIIDEINIKEIEPSIPLECKKAIYNKNTGVICPYDLALAYGEIAFDNNVNFKLEEEVLDIKKESKGFKVTTNKNRFSCKIVINTTPNRSLSIDKEETVHKDTSNGKMKYFTINKDIDISKSNMIFNVDEGKEVILTVPTLTGEHIGAVVTNEDIDNSIVLDKVDPLVPSVDLNFISTFYENEHYDEPFVIDDRSIDIGYIKIISKHYALVTMAPAISKIVCETIVSHINCTKRKEFIDKRRDYYKFRDLSNKERTDIIKLDARYGNMVCSCDKITEGEIIDAIRRPLGARTLEGVKRRTGAALGRCQGSQCLNKILLILARETNKSLTEIVKDSKNSRILLNRVKEFDTM